MHGHLLAAHRGRTGERYILSGENLSHREIITTIAEVVGGIKPAFRMPTTAVRIVTFFAESAAELLHRKPWVTRELLAGSDLNYHFSCRKARTDLGYRQTPLREAVQLTFNWYKENGLL